ncbi:ABC transporter ATP-binding protein [Actinocatenispora comari]|jgi:branched-chain amino acid transport system ATP-binding protein|uniref:ABC transporter ATP-binding protein n=1 Tax=Actinocatenispora comari TaxID=2807577 RepID=A0A8J4AHC9_9ACTN|nr:ABC transporter ATP-binding protein [Actinocatenispora comari]
MSEQAAEEKTPSGAGDGELVLSVTELVAGYDRIEALHGIDIEVRAGEAVTLIGANGAGKTTLLGTIAGLLKAWRGRIQFAGEDVTRWSAERRTRAGLALVPEGRRVFAGLTVEENLHLGAYSRARSSTAEGLATVYELFPKLKDRRRQPAGTMSGGEQQMLAIGRALMSRPKLLLLDEPSLGLAPLAVREVADALVELAGRDTTLALVEQNAQVAFHVAQRGYLLDRGRVVTAGSVDELRDDPRVHQAYLGQPAQ